MSNSGVLVCNPALRDPIAAKVYPYLQKPLRLRLACDFMSECFEHSTYLEAPRADPYVTPLTEENNQAVPVSVKKLASLKFGHVCKVHLVDLCLSEVGPLALPSCAVQVQMARLPALTELGPRFLSKCVALVDVHISNLPELTAVGYNWLADCTALKKVEIGNLAKLQSIGAGFLSDCSALEDIQLHDLPNLEEVGHSWLRECRRLVCVSISDLPSLQQIGSLWLCDCEKLETVQLSRLPKLKAIGRNCFAQNMALRSVSLTETPSLETIGKCFLDGCNLEECKVESTVCGPGLTKALEKGEQ